MKSLNFIFFSVLFFTSNVFAIRNGTPVPFGTFVGIGKLNTNCTATLVASDVIVTAAHCLAFGLKDAKAYTFTLDNGLVAFGSQIAIQNNERFEGLALIKLDKKFTFVKLFPINQKQLFPGAIGLAFGYGDPGKNNHNITPDIFNGKYQGEVRFAAYEKMPKLKLMNSLLIYGNQTLSRFVTSSQNQIPLRGDSGGPVFLKSNGKYLFFGIVSSALVDTNQMLTANASVEDATYAAIYIPLHEHIKWLNSTLKMMSP